MQIDGWKKQKVAGMFAGPEDLVFTWPREYGQCIRVCKSAQVVCAFDMLWEAGLEALAVFSAHPVLCPDVCQQVDEKIGAK